MNTTPIPKVGQLAHHSIILAYRENTEVLRQALETEGFVVEVQRASYTEEEQTYSRTIRCLMNHRDAWKKAAERSECTLIVESDFVPCIGLFAMNAPFDPARHGPRSWAFLYAGGPRFLWAHPEGYLEGHSSCPVALLVTPGAAAILADYAEHALSEQDRRSHSMWDTNFQWWAMGRKARCFLPYRHYGEHGGIANPEHGQSRIGWSGSFPLLRRLEFLNNHHAECLAGQLAFLPPYSRGSLIRFRIQRVLAWCVGLGRVIRGRVAAPVQDLPTSAKLHIHWIAVRRLLF